MNVPKVNVTKIIPCENSLYGAYRDFVLNDCVEIRERVLKDGSKIRAGYAKNSKLSNFIQKISKDDIVEQEKFYFTDTYGVKKEKRDTQLEKITYNKIGDKLQHWQLFKTYENNVLIEKFEAFMDIIKGIDKSERNKYLKETKVIKDRINNTQYVKETYYQDTLIWRTTENDVDPEGLWKYE